MKRFPFLISIGIIGLAVFYIFYRLEGKRESAAAAGPFVIGMIQSVNQTGGYWGNDPSVKLTIQFYTLDGKKITATDNEVFALTSLAKCQPGYWAPVRYDPKNPQNIILDFKADSKTVDKAWDRYHIATGQLTQEQANTKENGVQTKGVVISSKPTDNIVNGGESEFELQIKITKPDGSPRIFTYITGLAQKDLQYAVTGAVVYVYYFPEDNKNVLVEWDND